MAGIIIGSISLGLTLLVYAYGAWRRFRRPRFWISRANVQFVEKGEGTAEQKSLGAINGGVISIAFVGGGSPRNVVGAALTIEDAPGSGNARVAHSCELGLSEVIHVPAEIAGRGILEVGAGLGVRVADKLQCILNLDTGDRVYRLPFEFLLSGDSYIFHAADKALALAGFSPKLSPLDRLKSLTRRNRR